MKYTRHFFFLKGGKCKDFPQSRWLLLTWEWEHLAKGAWTEIGLKFQVVDVGTAETTSNS